MLMFTHEEERTEPRALRHDQCVSTLFTLGYQKRGLQEFVDILREVSIDVLIDVRETAWSRKRGFSRPTLPRALEAAGIEYLHLRSAGSPRELRAKAQSHEESLTLYRDYLARHTTLVDEFDALVAGLHVQGKRVCIMCYERHPDDCHRSILAAEWQSRGDRQVAHLATDGAPRLLPAAAVVPAGEERGG
jgi:uncharacterized protein (DUF488 family)